MMRALRAVCVVVSLAATGLAQQPEKQSVARAVFAEMVADRMNPEEGHRLPPDHVRAKQALKERREEAIRADPGAFVPLVREALALPRPEDLQVPTTREGHLSDAPEQYQKQLAGCDVAYQILALLPAESRDPILRKTFDNMLAMARNLDERSQPEYSKWVRAGMPKKDEVSVRTNSRRAAWYYSRAAGAITCATTARSEVLIEPVFTLLASKSGGLANTCVVYLERFPQRYDEFMRRLNEIVNSGPPLDFARQHNIEQSIKRMQASRS